MCCFMWTVHEDKVWKGSVENKIVLFGVLWLMLLILVGIWVVFTFNLIKIRNKNRKTFTTMPIAVDYDHLKMGNAMFSFTFSKLWKFVILEILSKKCIFFNRQLLTSRWYWIFLFFFPCFPAFEIRKKNSLYFFSLSPINSKLIVTSGKLKTVTLIYPK